MSVPVTRPPRSSESAAPHLLAALRRFHLAVPGAEAPAPLPEGLLPAALHPFRGAAVRTGWPFFVEASGGAEATGRGLAELLEEKGKATGASRILTDNIPRLERRVRGLLDREPRPVPAAPLLSAAGEGLEEELGLRGADGERLHSELAALVAALPSEGVLVPYSPAAALTLMALAARARLLAARRRFLPEAEQLAGQAEALLEADDARRAGRRAGTSLGAAMGPMGQRLVDSEALSRLVGPPRGGAPLTQERRQGLEQARDLLRAFEAAAPQPVVVRRGKPTASSGGGRRPRARNESGQLVAGSDPELSGVTYAAAADPCAAALERFDREAEGVLSIVRAAHRVRLEAAGIFDPERHEPWLAGLTRGALRDQEMALVPPVVVAQGAEELLVAGGSFSRLLLSGRPVQLLLTLDGGAPPAQLEASVGALLDPALLGIGHREAFVHQGSPGRPRELFTGLVRGLYGARPALHVVSAAPASELLEPALAAAAAVEARATPLLVFDPEEAGGWWRRFTLEGNPAMLEDWAPHTLAGRTPEGQERELAVPFTFGDYALLHPGWAGELQALPAEVGEEQVEGLASWLELPPAEAARRLPYVWGADASGQLHRVAVTRRLARATGDRLAAWRTLQELAAVKSDATREAAEGARAEAEAAAERQREELATAHRRELERVRQEAVEEAVSRLTAALFEVDPAALALPAMSTSPLAGLAGQSVEEVADALLAAMDPAALERLDPTRTGNGRADALEQELLALIHTAPLDRGED